MNLKKLLIKLLVVHKGDFMIAIDGILDWYNYIWLAYNKKEFLITEEDYKMSLKNMYINFSQTVMKNI